MRGPTMSPASTISRLREYVERRRRRVVGRGDAVGEVRGVLPLRLREDLEAGVVQVRMGVDEAGDDGLAAARRTPALRPGPRPAPPGPTAAMRLSVTTTSRVEHLVHLARAHGDDARVAHDERCPAAPPAACVSEIAIASDAGHLQLRLVVLLLCSSFLSSCRALPGLRPSLPPCASLPRRT